MVSNSRHSPHDYSLDVSVQVHCGLASSIWYSTWRHENQANNGHLGSRSPADIYYRTSIAFGSSAAGGEIKTYTGTDFTRTETKGNMSKDAGLKQESPLPKHETQYVQIIRG